MICDEKEKLLAAYQSATQAFADSVAQLHAKIGTSLLSEYQALQGVSEEARLASERARLALEQHIASHRC